MTDHISSILASLGWPRPASAEREPYLDALDPRPCRVCGAETGSPVLETCEAHDDDRARRAVRSLHTLATLDHARAVADLYDDGAGMVPGETRSE